MGRKRKNPKTTEKYTDQFLTTTNTTPSAAAPSIIPTIHVSDAEAATATPIEETTPSTASDTTETSTTTTEKAPLPDDASIEDIIANAKNAGVSVTSTDDGQIFHMEEPNNAADSTDNNTTTAYQPSWLSYWLWGSTAQSQTNAENNNPSDATRDNNATVTSEPLQDEVSKEKDESTTNSDNTNAIEITQTVPCDTSLTSSSAPIAISVPTDNNEHHVGSPSQDHEPPVTTAIAIEHAVEITGETPQASGWFGFWK